MGGHGVFDRNKCGPSDGGTHLICLVLGREKCSSTKNQLKSGTFSPYFLWVGGRKDPGAPIFRGPKDHELPVQKMAANPFGKEKSRRKEGGRWA